jgi:hypothetical protein
MGRAEPAPESTGAGGAGTPHPPAVGGFAQPSPEGPLNVVDQSVERELHESYLTYAMSTIMDRA